MEFKKGHILPTVRIQKIVLENFKSVAHGEVLFNCGRKVIPQDTESDILGIYGQNGSGKTAVIEAIAILKSAMSGQPIAERYSDCISIGAEYSKLSFTFDLQYPPDNRTLTVVYSFKMDNMPNEKRSDFEVLEDIESPELDAILSPFYENKIRVFDEVISAGGAFVESNHKMQDILTTSGKSYPIGPVRKVSCYVGANKEDLRVDLEVNKRTTAMNSKSFVFSEETMDLFIANSNYSEYVQILMELKLFASNYLFVVDTAQSALGGTQFAIPLFNRRLRLVTMSLVEEAAQTLSERSFELLNGVLEGINTVLPALIPGMTIETVADEILIGKKKAYTVQFYSKRDEKLLPLRSESAGVIRIVSILSLIISAYNERSTTVAIDELDAGVYEFLLGELLSGLETYGKGQFVFTSHNLRPLEVLKKENIIFTTTNPDNRYIRLKGVGHSNNLRSLYLREILGDSQDEKIYDAAKRQRMNAAFMRVGTVYGEKK